MKRVRIHISALVFFMLFGASIFGYIQKPQQGNPHKQQGQSSQKQTQQHQQKQYQQKQSSQKQAQQQRQKQAQQQKQSSRQAQHQHQPPRQVQRTAQQRRQQEYEQHHVWQQRRATHWAYEHRTWQQRGGYKGYRIPNSYFHRYYGRNHWFRIYTLPFMYVGGYPRFQYFGYWFIFMDPYPEYWGNNWYQTDDVYVDYYYDGYYLFNRRYPNRPGIAISIAF